MCWRLLVSLIKCQALCSLSRFSVFHFSVFRTSLGVLNLAVRCVVGREQREEKGPGARGEGQPSRGMVAVRFLRGPPHQTRRRCDKREVRRFRRGQVRLCFCVIACSAFILARVLCQCVCFGVCFCVIAFCLTAAPNSASAAR